MVTMACSKTRIPKNYFCISTSMFLLGFFLIYITTLKPAISNFKSEAERAYQKEICKNRAVQTQGAFCIDRKNIFDGGSDYIDGKVCRGIEELIGYSTLGDFGAGLGQYGRCLLRKLPKEVDQSDEQFKKFYKSILTQMQNVDLVFKKQVIKSWEGFDGGINAEELSENLVKRVDLSKPFDLGKTFDWVMSLEVGEHIPKEFEDVFIDNVAKHAVKGVIISWAIPNQGGKEHVNEKSNEFVIGKFLEKEFTHDLKGQEFLRNDTRFAYFKNTIMVFRKI